MNAPTPADAPTAPCRADPERMFPTVTSGKPRLDLIERAKAVCRPCPLRDRCLAYALAHDVEGVWGGTTEAERKDMRRVHGITAEPVTLPRLTEPHGTAARYRRHLRDGDDPCGPCTDAQNRRRYPENNSTWRGHAS